MGISISNQLAEFASDHNFSSLPSKVVKQAKRCILDTVGVMIAGSDTATGKALVDLAGQLGFKEESTIVGYGLKIPSVNAALINGTMGHVHELDDGHRFALGHPGVTTIPAALAVGEMVEASGKELIVSTVLGYEVFIRLAKSMNPSHRGRGFHTTGTCGTFSSTIAASKLLGLSPVKIAHALGIAGLQAAGLMEVMTGESMVKPFNAGRAAGNGVLSALIADSGFTAPDTIIEGPNGYLRAYSDDYDPEAITEGLGTDYEIMNTYVKLHAACRHVHPAVDCTLQLVKNEGITPEQVESIEVDTYEAAYRLTGTNYEPKTASTAKFSIPYCVAVALHHGRVSPVEFSEMHIKDKELLDLARKVRVNISEEINSLVPDERGASVRISTKSGSIHEFRVDNPRGEPETFVSDEEIEKKFIALTKPVIKNKMEALIDTIFDLEKVYDIEEIARLLFTKK